MSTGGGYSKLKETMSTLGVPVMSPKNFICTERGIGLWWQEHLQDVKKAEKNYKKEQQGEGVTVQYLQGKQSYNLWDSYGR